VTALHSSYGAPIYIHGGCGGGGASTTGSVAGASGVSWRSTGGRILNGNWAFSSVNGSTDGTNSYGGGGGGGATPFGYPGVAVTGNTNGTSGSGFGWGGGGGGGFNTSGSGATGGDGYLRITYWSID
jgi:hypothetical protein